MKSRNKEKSTKGILYLIDDNDTIRYYLGPMIADANLGVEIKSFSSSEEFLDAYDQSSARCLLLDLRLPGMSGLDLLKYLREIGDSVPVVMISAFGDTETIFQARILGAKAFISKPFQPDAIINEIREVLFDTILPTNRSPRMHQNTTIPENSPLQTPLLKALAAVVGSMCHDLANSLTVAIASVYERRESTASDFTLEALTDAQQITTELHSFVRQAYTSPKQKLPEVSARELKQELRNLLKPLCKGPSTRLVISVGSLSRNISIPRLMLQLILAPLVRNANEAIIAHESRGKCRTIFVIVDSIPGDEGLDIVVSDSGPGWPLSYSVIQSMMQRGERVTSDKGVSRGYGLRHLYRVITALGGTIQLGERDGGGAKIHILIPWRSWVNEEGSNKRFTS